MAFQIIFGFQSGQMSVKKNPTNGRIGVLFMGNFGPTIFQTRARNLFARAARQFSLISMATPVKVLLAYGFSERQVCVCASRTLVVAKCDSIHCGGNKATVIYGLDHLGKGREKMIRSRPGQRMKNNKTRL